MTDTPTSPTLAETLERLIKTHRECWPNDDHSAIALADRVVDNADAILAALRSPDASGEYARGFRDAANVALAIELKTGDPKCVRGHDRCESGADEDCPYCERKTPVAAAILALPQSAAAETRSELGARLIGEVVREDIADRLEEAFAAGKRSFSVKLAQDDDQSKPSGEYKQLIAALRAPSAIPEAAKPAPGQGELHYYTLGHNADRVCTRCEFNLSADARDHQWVHDQTRDEAVRAETALLPGLLKARSLIVNLATDDDDFMSALDAAIADERARATTGGKEGSVSEK